MAESVVRRMVLEASDCTGTPPVLVARTVGPPPGGTPLSGLGLLSSETPVLFLPRHKDRR